MLYAVLLLPFIIHVELKLLVHTEVGSIQGVPADDGDYVMFLGVPYAKVNFSNPFGDSLPQPKFKEIFQANNDSIVCPQLMKDEETYGGDIDCLRMNIYVPKTTKHNKAVFFYIFGGNNKHGHNRKSFYGPKYLIQHDIILVIINYRLGAYGFFCTDHPEIPGNQGLKDQYKAMQWVKDNIRAFGGDPRKITIGGHSSGSMCVDAHLLTKQPRLFQQAILQSGTGTNPSFILPRNNTKCLDLSDKLGYKTNDVSNATSFLAKINPEIIINITKNMVWRVCIEKKFKGVFRYIHEHPEVSEAINVDGMNILGGFTNRECVFCSYHKSYKIMFNMLDVLPYKLNSYFNLENNSKAYEIVRHFYYENDTNYQQNTNGTIEFLTDYVYIHPMQRTLLKYSKRNATIFQYMFSFNSKTMLEHRKENYNVTERGATHGDELAYMFNFPENEQKLMQEDYVMIKVFTKLWTNFIKYGNPTSESTDLIPVSWPPLTADSGLCLQIDTNLTVISRPFHKNMAFWDLFFYAYRDKLRATEKSSANCLSHINNINVILIYIIMYT